jgi:uncharacterized protein YndB with AHSA1/START domain
MTQPGSGKLEVTAPSDLEIVLAREFDAPRDLVFDCFTKPEHLRRWFGLRDDEMTVCEVDLRVGGKWRFVLRTGGQEMGLYGEFLEIEPPSRLVQTENFEGEFFEMMGAGTINTMVLEERDGKTLMINTVLYKTKEARDTVLQSPMAEGAGESFDRLEELLRTLV